MPKGRKKGKYEKALLLGRRYYEKWRRVDTYCPAFNQKVLITRIGWDHLVSSRFRTKVERMERLKMLPLAKKLIEKATTYQEYRHKNMLHYFSLVAEMDGRKIKVVLSSKTKEGIKNFLSVMVLR